jgi:HK97 family phage major capsid protein
MRKSIELQDEKLKLTADYRAVLDKADSEGRSLNAAETETLRKMDARFKTLEEEISMYQRQEERERGTNARQDPGRRPGANPSAENGNGRKPMLGIRSSAEYDAAFNDFLRRGQMALSGVPTEIRAALQSDSDTSGGYTVASEQFVNRFIQRVDDQVFIRQLATKDTVTTAQSLGIPTLATDPDDADWTSELGTGNEDPSMSFGKRELFPHPLAKRIKISKKLLRLNPIIADKVQERLAYKFAIPQEKAFLLGSGAQQPLGVFTPTADGISVSRDVVTGSATAILADSLFDAFYTLKAAYQKVAVWLFHRTAIQQIRKLKDAQNRYLWEPAITAGQPDMILGRPFYMSEYVPNTFTTGQYVGIIGDFSKYQIVDALSMEVQRLEELYAESNQVGFIGCAEVDGMPVLEEAFVRLKTS